MEKYLIAKEKNVKTSFWFCFDLFSLSEKCSFDKQKNCLCLQTNAIITKTTTFYSHTHQTKKRTIL